MSEDTVPTPARKRRLPGWVRWLHVYVSMFGFLTLLFFAVTGLTLNHAGLFERGEEVQREESGTVDSAWLPAAGSEEDADWHAVATELQRRHDLRGALADLDVDDVECVIVFKGPGYTADVVIQVAGGAYSVYESERSAMAVLDDLHKGRDSGSVWSIVVDASAILMAFTSISGLWLLFYVKRWRRSGLVTALAGAVVLVVLAIVAVL